MTRFAQFGRSVKRLHHRGSTQGVTQHDVPVLAEREQVGGVGLHAVVAGTVALAVAAQVDADDVESGLGQSGTDPPPAGGVRAETVDDQEPAITAPPLGATRGRSGWGRVSST